MKRIVFCLLLTVASLAFADDVAQDLRLELCRVVHQVKVEIKKKTGYLTEAMLWTDVNYANYGTESVYGVYLETGIPYVFYTMSTGTKVRPCIYLSDGEEICGKPGRLSIMQFQAKENRKHFLTVKGMEKKEGWQCSYLTYLWKGDSKTMKLQEEYETPDFWSSRGYKPYHPRDYPDPEY